MGPFLFHSVLLLLGPEVSPVFCLLLPAIIIQQAHWKPKTTGLPDRGLEPKSTGDIDQ